MRAAPLTTVAKLCVALGVTLAATTGCLMPRGGSVFEDTQRRYTQLIRWSEGNPLFLEECVRALNEKREPPAVASLGRASLSVTAVR